MHVLAGQPAEAVDDRRRTRRAARPRQAVAPCESAKSSLPQPGAMWTMPVPFVALDVVPGDDAVRTMPALRRQLVERPAVAAGRPGRRPCSSPSTSYSPLQRVLRGVLGQVVSPARPARTSDVGRAPDAPRRRRWPPASRASWSRPAAMRLGSSSSGKRHVDREVRALLIALGHDLVLGDAGAAARAPGHHVVALVDPALLVARSSGSARWCSCSRRTS